MAMPNSLPTGKVQFMKLMATPPASMVPERSGGRRKKTTETLRHRAALIFGIAPARFEGSREPSLCLRASVVFFSVPPASSVDQQAERGERRGVGDRVD